MKILGLLTYNPLNQQIVNGNVINGKIPDILSEIQSREYPQRKNVCVCVFVYFISFVDHILWSNQVQIKFLPVQMIPKKNYDVFINNKTCVEKFRAPY